MPDGDAAPASRASRAAAGASDPPGRSPFVESLIDTELYSVGAFFCDHYPELVGELVERSEAIERRGLESFASAGEVSVEETFDTLLAGLAVRYHRVVSG